MTPSAAACRGQGAARLPGQCVPERPTAQEQPLVGAPTCRWWCPLRPNRPSLARTSSGFRPRGGGEGRAWVSEAVESKAGTAAEERQQLGGTGAAPHAPSVHGLGSPRAAPCRVSRYSTGVSSYRRASTKCCECGGRSGRVGRTYICGPHCWSSLRVLWQEATPWLSTAAAFPGPQPPTSPPARIAPRAACGSAAARRCWASGRRPAGSSAWTSRLLF